MVYVCRADRLFAAQDLGLVKAHVMFGCTTHQEHQVYLPMVVTKLSRAGHEGYPVFFLLYSVSML